MPLWLEELVCKVRGHDDTQFTMGEFLYDPVEGDFSVRTVMMIACSRCGKVGESAGEVEELQ